MAAISFGFWMVQTIGKPNIWLPQTILHSIQMVHNTFLYAGTFSLFILTSAYQGTTLSLTNSKYSLVKFPNCIQKDVTAQHLGLLLGPEKPIFLLLRVDGF